jgi:hypothetical protein
MHDFQTNYRKLSTLQPVMMQLFDFSLGSKYLLVRNRPSLDMPAGLNHASIGGNQPPQNAATNAMPMRVNLSVNLTASAPRCTRNISVKIKPLPVGAFDPSIVSR